MSLRAFLALAFCVAVALRLGFALGYWVGKPLTHDEQEYLALAGNLVAGEGLVYDDDGREHFGRAPGYPVFVGAVLSVIDSPSAVRAVQSVLGGLGVVLIAMLAARAAGQRAAMVAATIAAIYPPLVWMPAYLLSETLYSVLALAAGLLLWRALDSRTTGLSGAAPFLATGVCTGLAALVRPVALPFLALATFALVARRSPGAAAALVVGAALVIAPWTAWKNRESGRFVLIASEGGITFWTGNNPRAIGEGDMAANPEIKQANHEIRAAHPDLGPDELETVYYREAWKFIREEPLRWIALFPRKLFYLCVPIGPSYRLHSPLFLLSTWISYLSLLPFALVGAGRLARSPAEALPLWLMAGAVVLVCLVFFPQERFRVPVLEPVLIVCAASLAARVPVLAEVRA